MGLQTCRISIAPQKHATTHFTHSQKHYEARNVVPAACYENTNILNKSDFGNGDGTFGANLDTGLATQALVGINRLGLAVPHLENLSGASVYTLFITRTFVFVDNDFPHGTASK
jgi:hypothetical protein